MTNRIWAIIALVSIISIYSGAETPSQEPTDHCIRPEQAKKNLKLFEALDKVDIAAVKESIEQGADPNCAFPKLDPHGQYEVEHKFDIPLYRASKAGFPADILAFIKARTNTEVALKDKEDAKTVGMAYMGFYWGQVKTGNFNAFKIQQFLSRIFVVPDETPQDAFLTPDEIRKATVDPKLVQQGDPWAVLAAQAPLESTVIGGEHLRSVLKYAPDKNNWEYRAKLIRENFMKGAHLDPLPAKTPLYPQVTRKIERHSSDNPYKNYSVENVYFEATPGFFVTGNLFKPLNRKGPFPAVLIPHGHFGHWGGYARTLPENQILATRLVEMGAVVFTYDMIGWGDSQQLDHPDSYGLFWGIGDEDHFKDGTKNNLLELQLWDSMRSVDFVESLRDEKDQPLVDMTRVGVTGASGGATQALYLAAVDQRIKAASLVVMITAGYTGDDHCEDGMPVHSVEGERKTNNVEIAATLAPRDLLIISDGHDWTKWFPGNEYPYLKRIWGYYDLDNHALNFHFKKEVHDYQHHKRNRTYDFFSVSLGLPKLPDTGSDPQNPDNVEGVTLENPELLKVFTPEFPRPSYPMTHLMW